MPINPIVTVLSDIEGRPLPVKYMADREVLIRQLDVGVGSFIYLGDTPKGVSPIQSMLDITALVERRQLDPQHIAVGNRDLNEWWVARTVTEGQHLQDYFDQALWSLHRVYDEGQTMSLKALREEYKSGRIEQHLQYLDGDNAACILTYMEDAIGEIDSNYERQFIEPAKGADVDLRFDVVTGIFRQFKEIKDQRIVEKAFLRYTHDKTLGYPGGYEGHLLDLQMQHLGNIVMDTTQVGVKQRTQFLQAMDQLRETYSSKAINYAEVLGELEKAKSDAFGEQVDWPTNLSGDELHQRLINFFLDLANKSSRITQAFSQATCTKRLIQIPGRHEKVQIAHHPGVEGYTGDLAGDLSLGDALDDEAKFNELLCYNQPGPANISAAAASWNLSFDGVMFDGIKLYGHKPSPAVLLSPSLQVFCDTTRSLNHVVEQAARFVVLGRQTCLVVPSQYIGNDIKTMELVFSLGTRALVDGYFHVQIDRSQLDDSIQSSFDEASTGCREINLVGWRQSLYDAPQAVLHSLGSNFRPYIAEISVCQLPATVQRQVGYLKEARLIDNADPGMTFPAFPAQVSLFKPHKPKAAAASALVGAVFTAAATAAIAGATPQAAFLLLGLNAIPVAGQIATLVTASVLLLAGLAYLGREIVRRDQDQSNYTSLGWDSSIY